MLHSDVSVKARTCCCSYSELGLRSVSCPITHAPGSAMTGQRIDDDVVAARPEILENLQEDENKLRPHHRDTCLHRNESRPRTSSRRVRLNRERHSFFKKTSRHGPFRYRMTILKEKQQCQRQTIRQTPAGKTTPHQGPTGLCASTAEVFSSARPVWPLGAFWHIRLSSRRPPRPDRPKLPDMG